MKVTIDLPEEQAAILLKMTNSSSLEEAVLTAINGRLHMMGIDLTPSGNGAAEPLKPLSAAELDALVQSTREGLEEELAKASL